MIPVSVPHRIHLGNDRKAVEVEVDGQWYDGELRSWDQADDGSWSGVATWRRASGELLVRRFPAERIRELASSAAPRVHTAGSGRRVNRSDE